MEKKEIQMEFISPQEQSIETRNRLYGVMEGTRVLYWANRLNTRRIVYHILRKQVEGWEEVWLELPEGEPPGWNDWSVATREAELRLAHIRNHMDDDGIMI